MKQNIFFRKDKRRKFSEATQIDNESSVSTQIQIKERKYKECCNEILDSDLLLYRKRGVISTYGRGVHSHAGKAAWWNGRLFSLEVSGFHGGRAVLLESQVRRYPGRIDVFRTNPNNRWAHYKRDDAIRVMQTFAGCNYGYWNVIRTGVTHLPLIRFFLTPKTNDACTLDLLNEPPFCSQACAVADRVGGGVDPIPYLADHFTEPADLARSMFYEYLFTVIE